MTSAWTGYERMARHVAPAARQVFGQMAARPGPLLDIGSGSGNGLVLAAAHSRWAVGVDLAPQQLRAARAVTSMPQARADVATLPFRAGSFAGAMSNFGLIFATNPSAALAEAARCLRADGVLVFTAWQPGGWPGSAREVLASHLGADPAPFPVHFGTVDGLERGLPSTGFELSRVHEDVLRWHFEDIDDGIETLTTVAGGLRALRTQLVDTGRWPAARRDLHRALAPRFSQSSAGVELDDPYLLVTAVAVR